MTADQNSPRNEFPVAVRQSALPEAHGHRHGSHMVPSGGHRMQDPVAMVKPYLHALRRRSLLAFGLALLAVTIVAPLVWYMVPSTYTAEHYLRVSPQVRQIVFDASGPGRRTDFGLYRNTQEQLIRSPFVILEALRDPAIGQLKTIRELEAKREDPVAWLQRNIRVVFPGGSEIMRVSLSGESPQEVTQLVLAVVNAYLREVVQVEQQENRRRLDDLDRLFAQRETELRSERTALRKLAERLGAAESETLTFKAERTLEEYSALRQQQMRVQFELLRTQGELAAQQGSLERLDETQVSDVMLAMYAKDDAASQQLADQLAYIQKMYEYEKEAIVPGAAQHHLERRQRDLAMLEEQYTEQQKRLREELMFHRRAAVEDYLGRLQRTIRTLEEQEKVIASEVDRVRDEAERLGTSSIDIEMMRVNIENMEKILGEIGSEREKLRIEVDTEARVTELIPAREPVSPDANRRVPLAVLSGLFAFGLPLFCVAWWDARGRRINEAEEVSKDLGLTVLGAVPVIPHRVIARLNSPSGRNQEWQNRLTEAVDGIMARLLRKAQTQDTRTVLVTSAISGEGKTTLATQLAMSLARNGHRTALVDFDLRRPTLNQVFGLGVAPGISEILRSECDLADAVQEAGNRLTFLSAGRWDRNAMAALTNGAAEHMLRELRGEYDFVVLDSSPILPVADTRFVSPHVDLVVLSVRRDHSSAPKMRAACEILAAFGAKHVETVVIGPSGSPYYYNDYYSYYHSSESIA
ncbi:MAG: AAA family ATPase [Thermoguttaceae bacterium]|jgi:capsular exopolysaccharide synthesis family protein|nr:AAA family ATPase [Thermoguttaceae bacterium]